MYGKSVNSKKKKMFLINFSLFLKEKNSWKCSSIVFKNFKKPTTGQKKKENVNKTPFTTSCHHQQHHAPSFLTKVSEPKYCFV
jgi:hypothetical protein